MAQQMSQQGWSLRLSRDIGLICKFIVFGIVSRWNIQLRFCSVGESAQGMLDAKMNAFNERLNRLGEKYEKIKQLEDQMKQSNQVLDLLVKKR